MKNIPNFTRVEDFENSLFKRNIQFVTTLYKYQQHYSKEDALTMSYMINLLNTWTKLEVKEFEKQQKSIIRKFKKEMEK